MRLLIRWLPEFVPSTCIALRSLPPLASPPPLHLCSMSAETTKSVIGLIGLAVMGQVSGRRAG